MTALQLTTSIIRHRIKFLITGKTCFNMGQVFSIWKGEFEKNIFPQLFDDAVQEAYMESTETYTKLFEDAGKYRAIMSALAQAMFDEFQNSVTL